MKMYAKKYGDFTIVDGTHNTVMYDLKLMPYTNVDCLGKNILSGFCLDESENGESIQHGLENFGLANPGATLMTDGGSAYPMCASQTGMVHVLCTQHFQQDVFASCGGMGDHALEFKQEAMALIYSSISAENWEEMYRMTFSKFQKFSSAMKCLQKIFQQKRKVCRSFTGTVLLEHSVTKSFAYGNLRICVHLQSHGYSKR